MRLSTWWRDAVSCLIIVDAVRVGCFCVTKATDQRGVLHFPTSLNNSFSWYGTGW